MYPDSPDNASPHAKRRENRDNWDKCHFLSPPSPWGRTVLDESNFSLRGSFPEVKRSRNMLNGPPPNQTSDDCKPSNLGLVVLIAIILFLSWGIGQAYKRDVLDAVSTGKPE